MGFSTLLLRDHFDQQLAPIVAMTAAACATETLRVGCLVFANDYRHPLVLAKELATLDRLSGGRLEVGLGAGWMGSDYEQAGLSFDAPGDRVTRMQEVDTPHQGVLRRRSGQLLGRPLHDHRARDVSPRPQQPHPPILIVAGGPRMTRFAAAEADIVAINPATKSNEAWADQNIADASAEAVDRKIATDPRGSRATLRRDRAPDRRAVRRAHRRPRGNGAGHRGRPPRRPCGRSHRRDGARQPVRAHRQRGPDLRHPRRAA